MDLGFYIYVFNFFQVTKKGKFKSLNFFLYESLNQDIDHVGALTITGNLTTEVQTQRIAKHFHYNMNATV